MRFEIRLFATLKDRAGQDRISVTVSDSASVLDLLQTTAEAYPDLAAALPTALVAVNMAYASPDTTLKPGDEIAFFPPVSGGEEKSKAYPTYFSVTTEKIDLSQIHEHLVKPEIGSITTFTGYVRGQTEREGLPASTRFLEYESYEEMAISKMSQIVEEIWERWPLVRGVAIVQRVGKLDVGQVTTIVACAAAHRDQGSFEAARYGIDRLKEIVPVWKREVDDKNAFWVEGDYRPTEADN
jgi:molybdopterin synthase catalytic subunit